jgi:hypothetical protein
MPAVLALLQQVVGRRAGQVVEVRPVGPRRGGGRLPAAVVVLVMQDRPEPAAEALGRVVLEGRQSPDQPGEDVLDEVVGVGLLKPGPVGPEIQERGVQGDEPVPGGRLPRPFDLLQQCE